ncbi:MAG: enoyl-CoA hydratase-related protein [Steroidobacteraceae bacterium]|jgi:enoyl-CoA hydratase/carnithine racemase|nr:enoyl-CoA hydratase-related protein [Steroidobacteraceae bacterium]
MSDIQTELHPPLAWVVLNRPERRNAVTAQMWAALPGLAAQLAADPAIRVALVRGAGHEAFSAGADIVEMTQNVAHPERMRAMQQAVLEGQLAWARLAIPTIAVIRGACTGGGCGLALACDLRLAADDSFFAIPPARLGLVYALDDTRRLVDLVGPARAKEILFTGRRIAAREALDLGLVNEVVPAADLEARALELAAVIAGNAGNSIAAAKHVVNLIMDGTRAETPATRAMFDEAFNSAEFAEGARAFLEKRAPRFR